MDIELYDAGLEPSTLHEEFCDKLSSCHSICPHHHICGIDAVTELGKATTVGDRFLPGWKEGCRHCEFLHRARRTIVSSEMPTILEDREHPLSAWIQLWRKLRESFPYIRRFVDVYGLDVKSCTTLNAIKDNYTLDEKTPYRLIFNITMKGEHVFTMDYSAQRLEGYTVLAIPQLRTFDKNAVFSATSLHSWDFVWKQYNMCGENHVNNRSCTYTAPTSYPTRLLDLRFDPISLSEPDRLPRVEYLALSYARSKSCTSLMLKTTNLKQRLENSLEESLPQTFADAVTITRKLGYKWLWIDCLCICQDDEADIERETAKLYDIYSQAYLVISADGADNVDSGFCDRKRFIRPIYLWTKPYDETKPQEHYRLIESCKHLDHSTMEQDAWCLQEQIVAQRILRFLRNEAMWECKTTTICGCGISGWGLHRDVTIFERQNLLLRDDEHSHLLDNDSGIGRLTPHDYWHRMIEDFTNRQIARLGDRTVAISALATKLSLNIEDDYLAGIWRRDAIFSLAWRGHGRVRAPVAGYDDSLRVPSWSWLWYPGAVCWPSREETVVARLLSYENKAEDETDKYTKLRGRWLRVYGPVATVTATYSAEQQGFRLVWSVRLDSGRQHGLLQPINPTANGVFPSYIFDDWAMSSTVRRSPFHISILRTALVTQAWPAQPPEEDGTTPIDLLWPCDVSTVEGTKGEFELLWLTGTTALALAIDMARAPADKSAYLRRIGLVRCAMPHCTVSREFTIV